MKKINILLFFLSALFMFSACSKDEDKVYLLTAENATAPTVNVEGASNIVVSEEIMNTFPAILNWSRANFGKDIVVEYILEMDTTESFATAKSTSLGNTVFSRALSTSELNTWAMGFGGYDSETNEVFETFLNMRILATPRLESSTVVNKPDTLYSNTVSFMVLPYVAEVPFKDVIYLTGSLISGVDEWNNDANGIGKGLQILFADDSKIDNKKYTYTGSFKANAEFKMPIAAGKWDPCWGGKGTAAGSLVLENNSANVTGPSTAGVYTLSIDLDAETYSFAAYTGATTSHTFIGIVGDATAGGWDTDTELTQVSPHIWVATSADLIPGKLKFRADKGWDINWEENP